MLTAQKASGPLASLRPAIVNGHKSANDWLHVEPDGTFTATGYMSNGSGPWLDRAGSPPFFGLEVPQIVGGFTLYHMVPLVYSGPTTVTVDGRPFDMGNVLGMPATDSPAFYQSMYTLTAKFSVQKGWIRAESLAFVSRGLLEDKPKPGVSRGYDYPDASLAGPQMAQDATRPATSSPWLDVSAAPGARAFVLDGWINGDTEDNTGIHFGVNVPDRLGPAAIYHIGDVLYPKPTKLTKLLTGPHDAPLDATPFHYPIALRGGRLVGVLR